MSVSVVLVLSQLHSSARTWHSPRNSTAPKTISPHTGFVEYFFGTRQAQATWCSGTSENMLFAENYCVSQLLVIARRFPPVTWTAQVQRHSKSPKSVLLNSECVSDAVLWNRAVTPQKRQTYSLVLHENDVVHRRWVPRRTGQHLCKTRAYVCCTGGETDRFQIRCFKHFAELSSPRSCSHSKMNTAQTRERDEFPLPGTSKPVCPSALRRFVKLPFSAWDRPTNPFLLLRNNLLWPHTILVL